MKANEFRIGNYIKKQPNVRTLSIEDKLGVIIVRSISDGIINQWRDMGASGGITNPEPIPLTEEWLERLGFEFYDYVLGSDEDIDDNETGIYKSYKKQPDGKKYYYSVNFNSDNTIEFTIKVRWADEMVLSLIKHVHQLQNLYFALTGEELTIQDV